MHEINEKNFMRVCTVVAKPWICIFRNTNLGWVLENFYTLKKILGKLSSVKVRLHTAINRVHFISWCMLYTYECNKMHSWENDVGEALNHIDQDTKSARLIAVCKRSLNSNTIFLLYTRNIHLAHKSTS